MPSITKEFYQVSVTMLIDKALMDEEVLRDESPSKEAFIQDRLQRGIEVPIESIEAVVIL